MTSFWKTKTLDELTESEWESLCDHCGKCCLVKLQDEQTGRVAYTSVVCKCYNLRNALCNNYKDREEIVNDCVSLNSKNIKFLDWLPSSCAYKLLANGEPLPDWHHLVSGNKNLVHELGVSIKDKAISETSVNALDIPMTVMKWV
ncbi:YcgN family cysteine cluster protein [Gammaproteobacteria bacterium]|nr:YcgN family cysteine cluster protein [Gammaproteobacteria bacterium]